MKSKNPIDFVITWVDGSDPNWKKVQQRYLHPGTDNGVKQNRFRDWDLLRYWFRGVEAFAPWVHRIYFVTCGQCPGWLNLHHPKLQLVTHQEYIPQQYLPTFNSNVIELYLHRLPGLSEQFVLFNDDMYLTAPTTPEDFFKDGLPCESALMDLVTADMPGNLLPYFQINNFSIINHHFCKQEVLRKNFHKFFTPKYGKDILRNVLLMPFRYFSCFRDPHLPSSYRKETFEQVWEAEGQLLEASGMARFRSKKDYSHWLMKEWQICEGAFVPRACSWGRHFELHEDHHVERFIEKQTYRAVCLNDSYMTVEFDLLKQVFQNSFQKILPNRSEFELAEGSTIVVPEEKEIWMLP